MINDEAPCKECGHAWHRHHTPHGGCNQVVGQERDGFAIHCACAVYAPVMCGRCGHLQAEHADDDGLCDGACTTTTDDSTRARCECKGFIARAALCDWRVFSAASNQNAVAVSWRCAQCGAVETVGCDLGGRELPRRPAERRCKGGTGGQGSRESRKRT